MPLQHSHLHHLPPANHNLKKSSNRRKEKASAFLCKLPLNMKLNTTTYNKAAPRRKASFAIFYLLSPHGKGFHASLKTPKEGGLQSRPISLQHSTLSSSLPSESSRAMVSHLDAEKTSMDCRELEINIT